MFAPKIEAHALQSLRLRPHEKVLEIGTGSGYMAALLAAHADHVWSVEIVPQLAETARANIARLGISNISIDTGDGLSDTCPAAAHQPFDVIMLSGGVPAVPQELQARLKVGRRLFAIVGEAPLMTAQLITRTADGFRSVDLFETEVGNLKHGPAFSRFVF